MMRARRNTRLYFLRRGIGGHVEILGIAIQQQIAHRATHHKSLKTRCLQSVRYPQRAVADAVAAHLVRLVGNHMRRSHHTYRVGYCQIPV